MRRGVAAVVLALVVSAPLSAAPSEVQEIQATQERLASLLRRGDFGGLDAAIATLQERYDRGAVRDDVVVASYMPFAPAEWEIASRLDAWVARAPGRFQARLARGLYHYEYGMLARGTQRDEDVEGERLRAMRDAFARAARDLQEAVTARPALPAAWRAMLAMAAETRDSFELSHSYRAAVAAVPTSLAVRLTYVHALWRLDAPGALKRYADDVAAKPPGPDPRFRRFGALPAYYEGASLALHDDPGGAIELYDESIAKFDWPSARIQRAVVLLELGRLSEAEKDLRVAIAMRPWSGDAHFWLSTAMIELGKTADGLRHLDRAIALEPMNPLFRSNRASHRIEAGRTADALGDLDVALVFGAKESQVHATRASALIGTDPQEALQSIAVVRQLDPDSPQAQLLYVNALYAAHDCAARQALSRYVTLCQSSGSCGGEVPYWDEQIRHMRCQAP